MISKGQGWCYWRKQLTNQSSVCTIKNIELCVWCPAKLIRDTTISNKLWDGRSCEKWYNFLWFKRKVFLRVNTWFKGKSSFWVTWVKIVTRALTWIWPFGSREQKTDIISFEVGGEILLANSFLPPPPPVDTELHLLSLRGVSVASWWVWVNTHCLCSSGVSTGSSGKYLAL